MKRYSFTFSCKVLLMASTIKKPYDLLCSNIQLWLCIYSTCIQYPEQHMLSTACTLPQSCTAHVNHSRARGKWKPRQASIQFPVSRLFSDLGFFFVWLAFEFSFPVFLINKSPKLLNLVSICDSSVYLTT